MVTSTNSSACTRGAPRQYGAYPLAARQQVRDLYPFGTCQLQKIANDMGILGVSYPTDLARGKKADWTTTFPLYRDVNKCIKCMRCIQVCDKVQSLSVWDISGSGARTTIDVSGNRRDQAGGLLAVRSVHHALPDRRSARAR